MNKGWIAILFLSIGTAEFALVMFMFSLSRELNKLKDDLSTLARLLGYQIGSTVELEQRFTPIENYLSTRNFL